MTYRPGGRVLFHPHCHQRSLGWTDVTIDALRRVPDLEIEVPDAGCCGMAGAFGYRADRYELSVAMGERVLAPAVRATDAEVVATGTSCRHQIGDLTQRAAVHPLQFLDSRRMPMIPADETFDGTFPFAPHFSDAPGFRMHYVDEGAGEPIVCLHGEPTWGYLYRNFIPPLARTHRVVVPDHMGFGKSETPQDREYTLRTHVENLTALIEDLGLSDITFVGQDWGGLMAAGFTVRHPERVKRLCLMNTATPYGMLGRDDLPPVTGSRWFRGSPRASTTGGPRPYSTTSAAPSWTS